MDIQSIYQKTIKFSAEKHTEVNQTLPSSKLPYVVHLSNVAMEILIASKETNNFDLKLAIQVALLHDTLEDTNTNFDEIKDNFDLTVAEGVLALTKNSNIPKNERMKDSLKRIKEQPKEIWSVKLADRITNLQEPPSNWNRDKIKQYQEEAEEILKQLKGANIYLEKRLSQKINEYSKFFD